jgi:hypothetical protein
MTCADVSTLDSTREFGRTLLQIQICFVDFHHEDRHNFQRSRLLSGAHNEGQAAQGT